MNHIKQFLLFVGVLLPLLSMAQPMEVVDSLGQRYLLRPKNKALASGALQHEFRLGVGAYPILADRYDMGNVHWMDNYRLSNLLQQIEQAKVYYGPEYTTGVFTPAYYYRLSRRISLGASFSYVGFWRRKYSVFDHSQIGRRKDNYFGLMAQCRVTWLDRERVQLYSSLGLGPAIHRERDYDASVTTTVDFTGQMTFVGVSVGRRLFGFAELGVGVGGTMIMGIGYKFNTESKQ